MLARQQRALVEEADATSLDLYTSLDPFDSQTTSAFEPLVQMLTSPDDLKQCFLPERWPTDSVPRHPLVVSALESRWHLVAHLLPDWQGVMAVTGWDNVLNRMATKYSGNLKTMFRASFARTCREYLQAVLARRHAFELPTAEQLQGLLAAAMECLTKRLRPLAVHTTPLHVLLGSFLPCPGAALLRRSLLSSLCTVLTLTLTLTRTRHVTDQAPSNVVDVFAQRVDLRESGDGGRPPQSLHDLVVPLGGSQLRHLEQFLQEVELQHGCGPHVQHVVIAERVAARDTHIARPP